MGGGGNNNGPTRAVDQADQLPYTTAVKLFVLTCSVDQVSNTTCCRPSPATVIYIFS